MNSIKIAVLLAGLGVLALVMGGCGGGFSATIQSPDGAGAASQAIVTPGASQEGLTPEQLPNNLTAANFSVTLDGAAARVIEATRRGMEAASGLDICFVIDTTGSMGGEIAGVRDSIQGFADTFVDMDVVWSGVDFGDASRTKFAPTADLAAFKAWIGGLDAYGGGDAPENPLDPMMEVLEEFSWRKTAPAQRHFVVLTDVGAHQRDDGTSYCGVTGAEVLAACQGFSAFVHCISPDYSEDWAGEATAAAANDPDTAFIGWAGWDVRELADGGPPAHRTHNGTGGVWLEMPADGNVDLVGLGLGAMILENYLVVFQRPENMTQAIVTITATWAGGGRATWNLGTVIF